MGPKNPFDEEEATVAMGAEARAEALRARTSPSPRPSAERPASPPARTAALPKHAPEPKPARTVSMPALQARRDPGSTSSPSARTTAMPALQPRRDEGARFNSTFDGKDTARMGTLLGTRPPTNSEMPAARVPTNEQMKAVAKRFDGMTAARAVVQPASRLKPLEPELTSTPGARDPLLSRVVLDQFAPEVNPRYARGQAGHLFIWDFTHAMGCAVPRFRTGGELTLEQLCSWFRTLSSDAGWIRLSGPRAVEVAAGGAPVIGLPATPRNARIAVVRPDVHDESGYPLLASACAGCTGNQLTVSEAFGERHGDYYFHE